jgi:hypothetical protein
MMSTDTDTPALDTSDAPANESVDWFGASPLSVGLVAVLW